MEMKMQAWKVYLGGKEIDTVFYTKDQTAEDVRKSLTEHDGYDPRIAVKKWGR